MITLSSVFFKKKKLKEVFWKNLFLDSIFFKKFFELSFKNGYQIATLVSCLLVENKLPRRVTCLGLSIVIS